MKEIYLAGGCFWGTEKYFSLIQGVVETDVGYANGRTENPTYQEVCSQETGHAETVRVVYDPLRIGLPFLLEMFYAVIDPTSLNGQGADVGTQYRTGIYYVDDRDRDVIICSVYELRKRYDAPVFVEIKKLDNYYRAEEYHQRYLEKNPGGYCHISAGKFERARKMTDLSVKYRPKSKDELKRILTCLQYEVTQNSSTEPPFQNEYFDHFEKGVYVDVTNGEPLFVSQDKFESGCGWPSFAKPIDGGLVTELIDMSFGMLRTEVRSKHSNAHLGHVFNNGPKELGGRRYCINSASLRFVPKARMEREGYGQFLEIVK